MRRLALVGVWVLVAVGCAKAPHGPQLYVIDVDAPSKASEKFQFSAFFPGELSVEPGDAITFRNRSSEAPHTVTLGVHADRDNQPPLLSGSGALNPAVAAPCHVPVAPTPKLTACAFKELHRYDGTGYWNSGLLQPATAPEKAGAKDVTLRISKDTPAGRYAFVCVLHPFMNGTLTVVERDADRDRRSDVRLDARSTADYARKQALALPMPKVAPQEDETTVIAGWGNRVTAVNQFLPATLKVPSGATVRWIAANPYEPHTVTFGDEFTKAEQPGAFEPSGTESGGYYYGGDANSGLIGAKSTPFANEFSLHFEEPGTYTYACLLHPGHRGKVTVVA